MILWYYVIMVLWYEILWYYGIFVHEGDVTFYEWCCEDREIKKVSVTVAVSDAIDRLNSNLNFNCLMTMLLLLLL